MSATKFARVVSQVTVLRYLYIIWLLKCRGKLFKSQIGLWCGYFYLQCFYVALRWDFHNVPWYGAQKLCLIFWFQPGNCNSLTFYDYWSDQVSFILNRNPFEILSMMMTGDPLFVVVGEKKDFFWEREGNGKLLPFKGNQSVWI